MLNKIMPDNEAVIPSDIDIDCRSKSSRSQFPDPEWKGEQWRKFRREFCGWVLPAVMDFVE